MGLLIIRDDPVGASDGSSFGVAVGNLVVWVLVPLTFTLITLIVGLVVDILCCQGIGIIKQWFLVIVETVLVL